MTLIVIDCPHCGGKLQISPEQKFADCLSCGMKTAIIITPPPVRNYMQAGRDLLQIGEYEKADAKFSYVLDLEPTNPKVWLYKSISAFLQKNIAEGATCLEKYNRELRFSTPDKQAEVFASLFENASNKIINDLILASAVACETGRWWSWVLMQTAGLVTPNNRSNMSGGERIYLNEMMFSSDGNYTIVYRKQEPPNSRVRPHVLKVTGSISRCPGFGSDCPMHEEWMQVILKEPVPPEDSLEYKEAWFLVKKSTFLFHPELAVAIGFDRKKWQEDYAYEKSVGIKAFKNLECRQRYLREVAFEPSDKTIWHDEYIDNYTGTAHY